MTIEELINLLLMCNEDKEVSILDSEGNEHTICGLVEFKDGVMLEIE